MTSFIALYRGQSVADANLIAVSADPNIVALVSDALLNKPRELKDKVIRCIETGQRAAIELVSQEAKDAKRRN